MSYKAMDVAQFIINYSKESSISITNLKLQKLLYYVQAAFLIEKKEPCFDDPIMNWRHGPVVIDVYDEFKKYASADIDFLSEYITVEIGDDLKFKTKKNKYEDNPLSACDRDSNIIKKVIKAFASIEAWDMVKMTHEEDPWKLESDRNEEIQRDSIMKYFSDPENRKRIYYEK